jgi:hypothetical protein
MEKANEKSEYRKNLSTTVDKDGNVVLILYPNVSYCAGYAPYVQFTKQTVPATLDEVTEPIYKSSVLEYLTGMDTGEEISSRCSASDADTNAWLAYYFAELAYKRGLADPTGPYGGFGNFDTLISADDATKNAVGSGKTWKFMYENISVSMQTEYNNIGPDGKLYGTIGNFTTPMNGPHNKVITQGNSATPTYSPNIQADYVDLRMYKEIIKVGLTEEVITGEPTTSL